MSLFSAFSTLLRILQQLRILHFGQGLGLILLSWMLTACGPQIAADRPLINFQIADPKTLSSYLAGENTSRDVIAPTVAGLTRLNEDTLLPEPQLAEGWEVDDQGLRYVFTLRSGLRWSDGEPLTAADVDFTFNQLIYNEDLPISQRDVQRIGESGVLPKVTQLNDLQIEFVLPEPFAPFLLQAGVPIMPKHILQPTIDQQDASGNPLFLQTWGIDTPVDQIVGCGPFFYQSYVPNQRVIYRANPYYWKSAVEGDTLPRLDQWVLQIVDNQDTALLQFRSGNFDIYEVRGGDFQLLKREEDRDQFKIYNLGPTLNNNFIAFNMSQARNPNTGDPFVDPIKQRWFNDIHFRQAIAHAINKQQMVDSILQGLGEPQNYTISPASPFHLSPDQGAPLYPYDPDRARQILRSAGYRYNSEQQLVDPEGHQVRFILQTNAENNQRTAAGALIKADLAQVGITVDFVPIAFNTLVQQMDSREWESIMLGFGGGGTEPNNGANIWRSNGRLHIWNLGDLPDNPAEGVVVADWEREIDAIFAQGTRELEFTKRKALYDQFQIIAQEQLPLIGTFNPLVLVAIRDRVEGIDPRPILGPLWNLDQVSIAE